MNDIARFALDTALEAGALIVEERARGLEHDYKDGQELVTQADLKADRLIGDAIRARFPQHRILSEEAMPDLRQARELETPLWIIDPIDGTVNYAYGHSQVAVSIAYAEKGRVQCGVVHAPFQGETFRASRGEGAFLNDRPIAPSGGQSLRQSLVATGFPYGKENLRPLLDRLDKVLHQCRDIRRNGSAALDICWVAAGRLDSYYETVSPWDFAAARLIAMEAGARAGHFSPVPEGYPEDLWGQDILISTPALFAPMQSLLASCP
ncbi:MAG: inositol monophosphatase family protein [Oleiphilaceae bacterium]|nr:inositol monophosphatase family protein [Oleiphilaceae bacterium]